MYWEKQNKTSADAGHSCLLLCYTRECVKREEKDILQHQTTSVCMPFCCHPWTISDVLMYRPNLHHSSYIASKSWLMILHTLTKTSDQYNHTISSDVPTPQPTSLTFQVYMPPLHNILMPSLLLPTSPPVLSTDFFLLPIYILHFSICTVTHKPGQWQ